MNDTTYPQYQQPSGWNAMLPPRQPSPVLDRDLNVDLLVIGAGFTGLAAAKRWQEHSPDSDIVIIDSSEIGEGTPGRNSGFLLEISLANDAQAAEIERMGKCNQLITKTLRSMTEAVANSSLDCQLERRGVYRAAAGSAGLKSLHQYQAFLEANNYPFDLLNRQQLSERLGTEFYREGLYSPHCYLAQPAALIRNLAEKLSGSIRVFENTPANSLRADGRSWSVETPAATITAKKVVLANNAFSKQLGYGRAEVAAIYTYAGITNPLSTVKLSALGSDKNWGLLPTHRLGSTLRQTEDGRLLVRSMYGYEKEQSPERVRAQLQHNLSKRFPQLGTLPLADVWGGAVGFTMNGGAYWGQKKPGLFVSAGCNGGGVVKGTLFGELLADLAHGEPVPDVGELFGNASWMPPDPFRRIGFEVISAVERFKGRAEF